MTCRPSTTAASAAFSAGTSTPVLPSARARSAIGQHAFARAHRAGQREFADDDKVVELVGFDLFAGGQHADGDGQIEARPFLFHVGGREIDGRAAHRKFEAGIGQRGRDAVARFLHRRVRQTDDDDEGVAPAGVDLDFDRKGFNAIDGGGTNPGEHGRMLRNLKRKGNAVLAAASAVGWLRNPFLELAVIAFQ